MKWLFLVHRVQTPNSRERVKIWRLTKKVGAILYRNSVYVLPYGKERLEDFQWLSQQIRDSKGEASVFVSECSDPVENKTLCKLFERSRQEEYGFLLKSAEELTARVQQLNSNNVGTSQVRKLSNALSRLQNVFTGLQRVDFFKHPLSADVRSGLADLARTISSLKSRSEMPVKLDTHSKKDFKGKTWATRERIHIDRLCSAWLIRRFIDPKAKFVFAPETSLPGNAILFDVLGAEFSHHGDNCTYETLLRAFQINDLVLKSIAQIVHDIDLKDQKFNRPEASGIDTIVRSLSDSLHDDRKVLEIGSVLLDALYDYLSDGKKKR